MTVELGYNDGLSGIAPAVTRDNLEAILGTPAERDPPVLLTGMYAPPNMGEAYASEFTAILIDLAAEYDVLFFPFFLKDVATIGALSQPHGIHPNAEGVAVIVDSILPEVRRRVAEDGGLTNPARRACGRCPFSEACRWRQSV